MPESQSRNWRNPFGKTSLPQFLPNRTWGSRPRDSPISRLSFSGSGIFGALVNSRLICWLSFRPSLTVVEGWHFAISAQGNAADDLIRFLSAHGASVHGRMITKKYLNDHFDFSIRATVPVPRISAKRQSAITRSLSGFRFCFCLRGSHKFREKREFQTGFDRRHARSAIERQEVLFTRAAQIEVWPQSRSAGTLNNANSAITRPDLRSLEFLSDGCGARSSANSRVRIRRSGIS